MHHSTTPIKLYSHVTGLHCAYIERHVNVFVQALDHGVGLQRELREIAQLLVFGKHLGRLGFSDFFLPRDDVSSI